MYLQVQGQLDQAPSPVLSSVGHCRDGLPSGPLSRRRLSEQPRPDLQGSGKPDDTVLV